MPKNKKPAGGRPAKNFEPRRGGSHRPGAARAGASGSRSPKHRGYRPDDGDATTKKARWSAQDRAGRDQARAIRNDQRSGSSERSRGFDRDDRPAGRGFERDDRARRTERPQRFDRDDRPRRDDRTDRPRRFDRDERPQRGDRDERPRRFDRDDRPQRFERDDRPRRFDRDDRRGDRPVRADRDDRARTDRPRRDDRADRSRRDDRTDRPRRFDRDDRPQRFERDDRPRRFERDDRRGDRPVRADRDDRARTDRPRRGDRTDRPRRFERDDRPQRVGRDERPRRFDREERPQRTDRDDRRREDRTPAPIPEDVVHERLQAQEVDAASAADVSFADLGFGDNIVRALAALGAPSPFPIQAATGPAIIEGRDVLARGRTGSGKTIAFGAPMVESLLRARAGTKREYGRAPQGLILAPTRELALQIDRTMQPIARSVGLFTTQIYGGVPQARQVGALRKGVDIVIGTPGRIEDLLEQGKLDLSEVRIAVIDEADHMSELGFLEPVQRILRQVGEGSQKLLFSATLDGEVGAVVDEFLVDPLIYEVAGETQETGTIDHRVLVIEHRDKADLLERLVDRDGKTLVFTRTRAYAEMLADQFDDAGVPAVALHGDLNQARRTRNLDKLTSGRVSVLVATDVAARGIHVDDIDLVVQADPPDEYKTYLHRSGRTGRAGRMGTVVTLITRQRRRRMSELLERAQIEAAFVPAGPDDDVVDELSGRMTVADLTS